MFGCRRAAESTAFCLELYFSSHGKVGWLLSGQVATGLSAWWMQTSAPTGDLRAEGVCARQKLLPAKLQHCWGQAPLPHTSVPTGLSGSLAIWSYTARGVSLNRGLQFLLLGRHLTSPSEDELCVPVWVERAGLSWPVRVTSFRCWRHHLVNQHKLRWAIASVSTGK